MTHSINTSPTSMPFSPTFPREAPDKIFTRRKNVRQERVSGHLFTFFRSRHIINLLSLINGRRRRWQRFPAPGGGFGGPGRRAMHKTTQMHDKIRNKYIASNKKNPQIYKNIHTHTNRTRPTSKMFGRVFGISLSLIYLFLVPRKEFSWKIHFP